MHPDFNIDLGDTFMLDSTATQDAVNNKYLAYREPLYFDRIGNSVPIFLASGNHENEEGWNFDDTFSIALASVLARKLYYPTPINDGFYSGNTDILAAINAATYGDQYREDYYAWTWGDALFVVIDEFQYTMHLPMGRCRRGTDDPKTCEYSNDPLPMELDAGGATIPVVQADPGKQPRQVQVHLFAQMLGGKLTVASSTGQPGYVRGGARGSAVF